MDMPYKIGDKTKAACESCKSFVSTEFKRRNVPVSNSNTIVNNIIVGVCTHCDEIVIIPHESTHLIKNKLSR